MNPIVFALRRPYTVMVGVLAVVLVAILSMTRAKVDIFPNLNQPLIYVCQPYAGMTPTQMEGMLTHYYEYHFLYINGLKHVESKNIQGMALMKLEFHPGTDMSQALSEVVAGANRSRAFMPPGAHPPFITRLDAGSASVGYLVLSSDTLSIKEIQDLAMSRVRPMFAAIPGVSTPPAFGGNQRAIVVNVDPQKLQAQGLSLDKVTEAVTKGNAVVPSGNVRIEDKLYLVTTNAMVGGDPKRELGGVAVKFGESPVLLRDVATIEDTSDITAGYVLVDGRRSVYMLVTKRSDASTVQVVNDLKKKLPAMRDAAPGVDVEFAFDQSPIVTSAMWNVAIEGAVGALLTGLMVLLFLRDWRTVIVVVLNIPFALLASFLAMWLCGQTVNLMTLGGLALAVGILVDEATVAVENIHTQLGKTDSLARAVRRGIAETAVPRLLAMLCILAVFIPSFFMQGAARELFVPLSLAVGFAMIASYLLSSTFVPVMCVWLMKDPAPGHADAPKRPTVFGGLAFAYETTLGRFLAGRWVVAPLYLALTLLVLVILVTQFGTSVFPPTDRGQFQLRMKAPTGTRIERTEELVRRAIQIMEAEAGPGNVRTTVGYVGQIPSSYPIQGVYQWTSGPEEAVLKVALAPGSGLRVAEFVERLREKLPAELREAGLRLSFEPGDLVNEVMSFGSPNAVEVQVSGGKMPETIAYAKRLTERFKQLPELRDVQSAPAQDYPTLDVAINRELAATQGLTAHGIATALVPATSSSRFIAPTYWQDPKNGQSYLIQVQIPHPKLASITEIGQVPIRGANSGTGTANWYVNGNGHSHTASPSGGVSGGAVLLRDVATIRETKTPAGVDRSDMRRMISVTANAGTADLGRVGRVVRQAVSDLNREVITEHFDAREEDLRKANKLTPEAEEKLRAERDDALKAERLPGGMTADVRGQLRTLQDVQSNLALGLGLAVLAIFLLLTAYYQSLRLALVSVSAIPATLCGVGLALWLTGTTLNLQSFMGTIMAVGVAVANAILLVTFAERSRHEHVSVIRGAAEGAVGRLRAILMTSAAMSAGMLPLALGLGDGGDQMAPLGRAVLGGVIASTFATLFALPTIFVLVQGRDLGSASLDPDDPGSLHYDIDRVQLFPD